MEAIAIKNKCLIIETEVKDAESKEKTQIDIMHYHNVEFISMREIEEWMTRVDIVFKNQAVTSYKIKAQIEEVRDKISEFLSLKSDM